jgi:hypothetical protein
MARSHYNSFRVVAYSRNGLRGTYQRIVAASRTKAGAMKEYAEHMARFNAAAPANYSHVYLYQDDMQIESLAG